MTNMLPTSLLFKLLWCVTIKFGHIYIATRQFLFLKIVSQFKIKKFLTAVKNAKRLSFPLTKTNQILLILDKIIFSSRIELRATSASKMPNSVTQPDNKWTFWSLSTYLWHQVSFKLETGYIYRRFLFRECISCSLVIPVK